MFFKHLEVVIVCGWICSVVCYCFREQNLVLEKVGTSTGDLASIDLLGKGGRQAGECDGTQEVARRTNFIFTPSCSYTNSESQ